MLGNAVGGASCWMVGGAPHISCSPTIWPISRTKDDLVLMIHEINMALEPAECQIHMSDFHWCAMPYCMDIPDNDVLDFGNGKMKMEKTS